MAAAAEPEEPPTTTVEEEEPPPPPPPAPPATRACAFCGAADDGNHKRCGGCQNIFYCGSECQRLDRQRHKGECKRWKLEKEAARERELER